MRVYQNSRDYWSSSKFAKWLLRKCNIPTYEAGATLEEWRDRDTQAMLDHPYVFIFVDRWLDFFQYVVTYPRNFYIAFSAYIRYRFVIKNHLIDTKLPRGEYLMAESKILHGMFEVLVYFVEVEKTRETKEYSQFKYRRWVPFRSRELGLRVLESEAYDVDFDRRHYTSYAMAYQEIIELYKWWKDVRPNRPDPYEMSYDNFRDIHELTNKQEQEDTDMLIRLIKVMHYLY